MHAPGTVVRLLRWRASPARDVETGDATLPEKGGTPQDQEGKPPKWSTRAKAGLAKFLAYVVRDRAEELPKWKGSALLNE